MRISEFPVIGDMSVSDVDTADVLRVLRPIWERVRIPIAEAIIAASLEPDPADLMLSAGGVALTNPADAATAYGRAGCGGPVQPPGRRLRGEVGMILYITLFYIEDHTNFAGSTTNARARDYRLR